MVPFLARSSRSTPARLTSQASGSLAWRWLLLPALAYMLAGLFFRDPWKTDDALGLAAMLTAAGGGFEAWLLPRAGLSGQFVDLASPLTTWVGAVCITLFSGLFKLFLTPAQTATDAVIAAARLANLLWFAVMAGAVWRGTCWLGCRPQAQPLALPFGGEPGVRQYGHLMANVSTLLVAVTAGLMWRLHESSDVPALLACQALVFLALAGLPDCPRRGALLLGAALAGAFLTRGLIGALPLVAVLLTCCGLPRLPLWAVKRWALLGLLLALVLGGLWMVIGWRVNPAWMQHWWQANLAVFQWPGLLPLLGVLRDLPWFLWPTWPFALMALWRWRKWLKAPQALHVWLPFMLLLWPLVLMLFLNKPFEPEYSLTAIPCAVLTAFALPTLRRGWVNSLDWFAVMCFSLACVTVWLGWVALHLGWPAQIARNIARQTQGFEPTVSISSTVLAVLITAGWVLLVAWRLRRKPKALWRGALLYAGGAVATWLLLAALWMPALDYARSYRYVSAGLAAALAQHQRPGECLHNLGLGSGQQASFLIFDQIDLSARPDCPLLLQQTSQRDIDAGLAQVGLAALGYYAPAVQELWRGKRGADRRGQEVFRLLRVAMPEARSGAATP